MIDTISFWETKVLTNNEPLVLEAAFFRSYIAYEEFIRDAFVRFSLGNSFTTFLPSRAIAFSSENQLFELIKGDNSHFVDYLKAIPRCSKHIFIKDPFNIIFSDAVYSDSLYKMKYIRNYIAHRSVESREQYNSKVLLSQGISSFIEPGDYLLTIKKKNNLTYFSYYIDILKNIYSIYHNDTILTAL